MFQTILMVIGVIALIVIAAVGLVVLVFLMRMRSAWRVIKDLGRFAGVSRPAQLTLQRQPDRVWSEPAATAAVAALRAGGFVHAGTYTIAEMQSAVGDGWVREDGTAVALFSLNAAVPFWIDVFCRFADGATITVSNATAAEPARTAPWKQRAILPADSSFTALLTEFARLRGDRAAVIYPASSFAAEVAESYAREIEWRALSGPDEAEVRRVAKSGGMAEPDQNAIDACLLSEQAWCVDVLTQRIRPRLIAASGIDAVTWQRIHEDTHVVLDRMGGPDVLDLLPSVNDEGEPATTPPADPFSCLSWFNSKVPAERRLRLAARLDQPLRAELWVPVAG